MNKIIKNSLSATFVAAMTISATACDMIGAGSESESTPEKATDTTLNLFKIQPLEGGIQVAENKTAEGKCGEGKCGADKMKMKAEKAAVPEAVEVPAVEEAVVEEKAAVEAVEDKVEEIKDAAKE